MRFRTQGLLAVVLIQNSDCLCYCCHSYQLRESRASIEGNCGVCNRGEPTGWLMKLNPFRMNTVVAEWNVGSLDGLH